MKGDENREKLSKNNRSKSLKDRIEISPYLTDVRPQQQDQHMRSMIQNSSQLMGDNSQKALPLWDQFDKEDLYQNQINLKKSNNDLEKQVRHLKTKTQQLYQDLKQKDKLIEKFILGDVQEKYIQDSCIIQSYKQQILDLNKKLEEQDQKYLTLQTSLPFTKIQELSTEIFVYQEECERLRKLLETQFTDQQIQNFFGKFSPVPSSDSTNQSNKESQLQPELNKLNQQLQDLQAENEVLKKSLEQMEIEAKPIINVKLKKSLKEKSLIEEESSFKDQKLYDYVIQLEQNVNDMKKELQILYSNKIRVVLQSVGLEKGEQVVLGEEDMGKCVEIVQEYLPVVDIIMDKDYFQSNFSGFVSLTQEQMGSTSQFLINYIKEKQIPLESDIVRITGESIENPSIQNFLKYVSYQSMKSENTFPLQALKIYAHPDQSLSEIHDISEQEGHQMVQTIQTIIQNLDKKDLLSKLEFVSEGSLLDEKSFKSLLKVSESNTSLFNKLSSLLSLPHNGYLISLFEFKSFLNSIPQQPSKYSNQQDSNNVSHYDEDIVQEEKQRDKIIENLKMFVILAGLNQIFDPIMKDKNVRISQKQKKISVLNRNDLNEILNSALKDLQIDKKEIDEFLNELQINEKKQDVLVYKKLEKILIRQV